MKALLEGLLTVFKHLFMQPVTLEYPEKKRDVNENYRGRLSVQGCVGCGVCKKVCPSGAIEYTKNEDGKVVSYKFDLGKCIFCGNCMYYCPKSAIKMSDDYELATESKDELQLTYRGGADD